MQFGRSEFHKKPARRKLQNFPSLTKLNGRSNLSIISGIDYGAIFGFFPPRYSSENYVFHFMLAFVLLASLYIKTEAFFETGIGQIAEMFLIFRLPRCRFVAAAAIHGRNFVSPFRLRNVQYR